MSFVGFILERGTYPGDGHNLSCSYDELNKEVREGLSQEGSTAELIKLNSFGPGFFFNLYTAFYEVPKAVYEHIAKGTHSRVVEWEKESDTITLSVYQYGLLSECTTINPHGGKYEKEEGTLKSVSEGKYVIDCGEGLLIEAKVVPFAVMEIKPVGYWSPKKGNVREVYKIEDMVEYLSPQSVLFGQYKFEGNDKLVCGYANLVPLIPYRTKHYRELTENVEGEIDLSDEKARQSLKEKAIEAIWSPMGTVFHKMVDRKAFWWRFVRNTVLILLTAGVITFEVFAGINKWQISFGIFHHAPVWIIGLVVGVVLIGLWTAHTYNRYNLDISRGYVPSVHSLEIREVAPKWSPPSSRGNSLAGENGNGHGSPVRESRV